MTLAPGAHRPHIALSHAIIPDSAEHVWLPTILKGSFMNARFLRDEAARFRGMADDAGRDATKQRLLAMADDYEARAKLAGESQEPAAATVDDDLADAPPDRAVEVPDEPTQGDTLKLRPGRRIVKDAKETILVERRPAGRRGSAI
jgi:hypothetical protein